MVDELELPQVPKRGRGRPKGKPKIHVGKPKISNNNIYSTDGVRYDSPLTKAGTPRKRKQLIGKKRRLSYYGVPMNKQQYEEHRKECIIKLVSFCPRYATIYTSIVGEREDATYIDVMVCVNNRIYRITKLVAVILDKQIAKSKSRNQFDKITMKPPLDELGRTNPKRNNLRYAEELIKGLSMILFNVDDGFFWQDLSQIFCFNAEYRPKLKPHQTPRTKEWEQNIVDKVDEVSIESKPRKSFRVR